VLWLPINLLGVFEKLLRQRINGIMAGEKFNQPLAEYLSSSLALLGLGLLYILAREGERG